ncbi:MAG: hypothetical protein K9L18_10980 [Desulfarculaceae bacterium]|nr:hypothetical protein [Desulfarculaceae bacterium]
MIVALVLGLGVMASAEEKPSGTVYFKTHNVAVGIGVTWGDGVLKFKGKEYKFSIDGLSLLDLGMGDVEAKGNVYNLKKVEDFAGNYSSVQAGAALGKGVAAAQLVNDAGVKMNLKAVQQAARLTLAPGGMKITLKK